MGFRSGLVGVTTALALLAPPAATAAGDTTTPTLVSFSIGDRVLGAGDVLTVDYTFTDDRSTALSFVDFEFEDPDGRKRSLFAYKMPLTGRLNAAIPGDWVAGTYTLQSVYGADISLNLIQYLRSELTVITPDGAAGPIKHDFDFPAFDLTIEARAPDAPTRVTVRAGNGSASVSWREAPVNGSPLEEYVVMVEPGGHEVTVEAPATSATVDGLENGTPYTVVVRATNAIGTSPDSLPSDPVTPATRPHAVVRPIVNVKAKRIIVRWQAPDDGGSRLTGYRVIISGDRTKVPATGLKLSQRLKPGRYRLRIAAVNSLGEGSPSPVVKFRVRRHH